MSRTKIFFGYVEDAVTYIYTLINSKGMTVEITNFGGAIISIMVPDNKGKFEDVVLGCDKLRDYLNQESYFGAIIGRFANRIENSSFEVNGIEYKLAKNDGENHLHGGTKEFDKVVWKADLLNEESGESLELTYISKDGEEGYPGNLNIKVRYTLTEENELKIDYYSTCDKDTVVNLTNHSYFNLSGHGSGNILKHKVMINADKFTINDEHSIPTGELRDVKGTPMDFSKLTEVGKNISNNYEQIIFGNGFDHNYVLNVNGKSPEKAAEVYDKESGRVMEVYTTKSGIQFYFGNFLDGSEIGKGGVHYEKRSGLCLEAQYFPNSINHKNFPSPILRAGEEYKHTTIYKFSSRV